MSQFYERLYAERRHREHFPRPRVSMTFRALVILTGLFAIAALVAAGR